MASASKDFCNFKIHTQYSICEGAIKIDDLAVFCKENKIKSIGLCDSFNLCGALEFSEKISKSGTQPIIGSQINFLLDEVIGKLSVFAKSSAGYKNLTKLSSKSYLEINEKSDPHCKFEDLINLNDELILLSGNHNDLFGKLFKKNKLKLIVKYLKILKDSFSNRFYIEIQRHNELDERSFENYLIKMSIELDIPLIASQEIYYVKEDMFEAHDALICIGEKSYVSDSRRKKFSDQHYIKSQQDLEKLYSDIPEALENNYNFPYRFNFKPNKSKPILPTLKIKNNVTVKNELLMLAKSGLKNRLNNFIFKKNNFNNKINVEKKYEDRLFHELEIINSMEF